MPAKIITVRARTKKDLQKKIMREIKKQAKKGMPFVKAGYESRKVRRSGDFYEIDLSVHS